MTPRDRGGAGQPLLIARDLIKKFRVRGKPGLVHAVDGVSFTLAKAETLGIVGESGCGKSTLARLLLHLVVPDAGELIFDGEQLGAPGGLSRRELYANAQMVFQDSHASLNPRLSILQSLMFGPRAQGVARAPARERAERMLGLVGLDPHRHGPLLPHQLSGGQRQRVNIARALALEPRLLIMDEPVSALDKSVEAQVLNLLLDLKRELGLTYLFISHDLAVVHHIADRVLVMYLGQIMEIGEAGALYRAPQHPYTRGLLASRLSMDPSARLDEAPLTGDPPSPIDPPPGCRFAARCGLVEDICRAQAPVLRPLAAGAAHLVACHMAELAS